MVTWLDLTYLLSNRFNHYSNPFPAITPFFSSRLDVNIELTIGSIDG